MFLHLLLSPCVPTPLARGFDVILLLSQSLWFPGTDFLVLVKNDSVSYSTRVLQATSCKKSILFQCLY